MLIAGVSQAAVTVTGDVANPGPIELPAGGRLFDVISEAVPNAEGYWLAGVLLRQSLLEEQARLKAGVLFDLDVLQRMALLFDMPSRGALAQRLTEQVRQMPVTGRQIADLDPVAIEVGFARNIRLDDGDRLIYPKRVDEVEVLGAVAEPCHLPYQPLQEARDYLQGCSILSDAEADYLWLIQPNGVTRRVGIAHWNRESGHIPVAGSKILVPVKNDDLDPPLPELNQQLAELIATQLAEVVR
ncbi:MULTISPECIES: capsule biosynthesis GfcC family protein [Pseudomonas]|uniref:capsule biosynthesis GfcC family protein n=1 Tax=Pseudomonas TaxID=286 RepID=UPI001B32F48A|nr:MULTISPECIES: capsule biosynthesis GfcC family protein [Pseudomonas]MBP5943576.1 capsule biosynthesis GfcC family protein [Pseudomonas sp. P9(2020)]MBP5954099.1 capsule biosynthesis GfcC family protein [Pseudomonas anatoliensis]MBZ9562491.1 capsule biosynthesis GfcC family protein [Pseudomonas sp. P116]